jgi:chitin synthase
MNTKLIVTIIASIVIISWAAFSVLYLKYSKDVSKKTTQMIEWIKSKIIDPCTNGIANGFEKLCNYLSFTEKKYLYLLMILCANITFATLVFMFAGVRALTILLVGLKSKDIITALTQTIYYTVMKIRTICGYKKPEITIPKANIISVIPVYSETKEQIDQTIFSIINNKIGEHRNILCVICDGLDVDIQETLTETITSSEEEYVSWKEVDNKLNITYGKVNDTPCVIFKKVKNQGKRDTLIVGHDIFNFPRTNMHDKNHVLRKNVREKVKELYDMDEFTYMFCTDADSIISDNSFSDLIETIERRQAVACCGLVVIDFSESQWGFWTIFQNFQYLYGQYVRRGTENMLGKVTCLPGCITMFKIHEVASKAIAMYSELPHENDMLKTTVQLLGTDRRLTCSFMFQDKDIKIVYDIRAQCYTIPPNELYPYISQRRRWGSNSYFNTFCMIIGPNVHPITKFFACLDYTRLSLVYFRLFNTILFIYQIASGVDFMAVIPFLCVIMFPTLFFFTFSLTDPFLRKMYPKLLLGYLYNKLSSPPISMMALSNLYWNIGSTKWGGNQTDAPAEPNTSTTEVTLSEENTYPHELKEVCIGLG